MPYRGRKYKGATPIWAMTPAELLTYVLVLSLFFLLTRFL
jgi:hypothetical protein